MTTLNHNCTCTNLYVSVHRCNMTCQVGCNMLYYSHVSCNQVEEKGGSASMAAEQFSRLSRWQGWCCAEYREMFQEAINSLKAEGGQQVDIDFSPFATTAKLLYESSFVAERYSGIRAFLDRDKVTGLPLCVLWCFVLWCIRWSLLWLCFDVFFNCFLMCSLICS